MFTYSTSNIKSNWEIFSNFLAFIKLSYGRAQHWYDSAVHFPVHYKIKACNVWCIKFRSKHSSNKIYYEI